jgi:hypothetical protein
MKVLGVNTSAQAKSMSQTRFCRENSEFQCGARFESRACFSRKWGIRTWDGPQMRVRNERLRELGVDWERIRSGLGVDW